MSALAEAFLKQAESCYKNRNWKLACQYYDNYFNKIYPDSNTEMKIEDINILVRYAISLYEKLQAEGAATKKYDQEDIEAIASYMITAQKRYATADPKDYPFERRIDTYDILGQVALINNQFKNAAQVFTEGYEIAEANPEASWRLKLSLLYSISIAYEMQEKPLRAIEAVNKGLELITQQEKNSPSEEEADLLKSFREDFNTKLSNLQEDAKEQEENKDILKEDESEDDDINVEEEEEEAADENENADVEAAKKDQTKIKPPQ